MRRPLLLLCLLAGGCPKPGSPSEDGVRRWIQPSQAVYYTRVNRAETFELPDVPIKETWQGPAFEGERILYDVITENASTGRVLDVTRLFFGPEGYGYVGTIGEDGALDAWDPVQVVIPANAKVGDTWTATHTKASGSSTRSCEILPGEACEAGIVVVCDSERDRGRVILRDHFCEGLGWVGFEALVQAADAPTVRMWSEGVMRDGRPAPNFLGETPVSEGDGASPATESESPTAP